MFPIFIFICVIMHTFCVGLFSKLAHHLHKKHIYIARIAHILSEVEYVFMFWAVLLIIGLAYANGILNTYNYIMQLRFKEALFIFTLMLITGTTCMMQHIEMIVLAMAQKLHHYMHLPKGIAVYSICLGCLPLLGSLISEPAAIMISALILHKYFFARQASTHFKYFTLAALLVNISVGGALTAFSAPAILMIADAWQWNSSIIFNLFGIKAIIIVAINTCIACVSFYTYINKNFTERNVSMQLLSKNKQKIFFIAHLVFLAACIICSHYSYALIAIAFMFCVCIKYIPKFSYLTMLKPSIMVAGFLVALVIIGGQQTHWLYSIIIKFNAHSAFWSALGLTPIVDNAAITYLTSLVSNLNEDVKYNIVAGAIAGGGLTIIANAPNPIASKILQNSFTLNYIKPFTLLLYALLPTLVCIIVFKI